MKANHQLFDNFGGAGEAGPRRLCKVVERTGNRQAGWMALALAEKRWPAVGCTFDVALHVGSASAAVLTLLGQIVVVRTTNIWRKEVQSWWLGDPGTVTSHQTADDPGTASLAASTMHATTQLCTDILLSWWFGNCQRHSNAFLQQPRVGRLCSRSYLSHSTLVGLEYATTRFLADSLIIWWFIICLCGAAESQDQ
jgi:hypothetical protein